MGPFWEHVLGYWKESLEKSKKVVILRYEEMKMKSCFYLKEIAKFFESVHLQKKNPKVWLVIYQICVVLKS